MRGSALAYVRAAARVRVWTREKGHAVGGAARVLSMQLTVSRVVFYHFGEPIAVFLAAVVVEEHCSIAHQAVLSKLAGAVFAAVARRNGAVVIGGTLAAIRNVLADDGLGLTGKWVEAPPTPLRDPGQRHRGRATLLATVIQQIPAIPAAAANLCADGTVAVVAVWVSTPAALAGNQTRQHNPVPAGDGPDTAACHPQPVRVAAQTDASGAASAAAVRWCAAVAWAGPGGVGGGAGCRYRRQLRRFTDHAAERAL